MLKFVLKEPYLFTKFFFALEGRVLNHRDTNYILCAVHDHSLYATESYRRELGEKFDLVFVPHGHTLEP